MSELSPQAEASDMQLATTRTARDKTPPQAALPAKPSEAGLPGKGGAAE